MKLVPEHNLEKGKIPPQAIDIEEAVIGAMLIDSKSIIEIVDLLNGDMFYKEAHRLIFKAMKDLYLNSQPIDLLTVSNHLKSKKELEIVGGDYALILLTQKVASTAHIESHALIVMQKYVQRELISNSSLIIEKSYSDEADTLNILDAAYNNLNGISEILVSKKEILFSEIIDKQIEKGIKIYRKEIKPGLPTPIERLTEVSGGWRNSELIILAARPGMGKTAFVLSCALEVAKQNNSVAFFSLEMSKEKLTDRVLSMEGKIDGAKFNIHGLNDSDVEVLKPIKRDLQSIPLIIDDTATLTIEQFQIKAKRLKAKNNIKLIIIDYLQLMLGSGKNREQEISKISRGLKIVAKELNIPIIALSQLSRAVEQRGGNKRPLLSDLRESGAIEQDADIVMFIYRPEYYGMTEWDDYDRSPTENEAEYIVSKNRNGGLIRNRMKFEGRFTLFSDIEDNDPF